MQHKFVVILRQRVNPTSTTADVLLLRRYGHSAVCGDLFAYVLLVRGRPEVVCFVWFVFSVRFLPPRVNQISCESRRPFFYLNDNKNTTVHVAGNACSMPSIGANLRLVLRMCVIRFLWVAGERECALYPYRQPCLPQVH